MRCPKTHFTATALPSVVTELEIDAKQHYTLFDVSFPKQRCEKSKAMSFLENKTAQNNFFSGGNIVEYFQFSDIVIN